MKFEEYLETLPKNLLSGEDVQLPEKSFREIFKFTQQNRIPYGYSWTMDEPYIVGTSRPEGKIKRMIERIDY